MAALCALFVISARMRDVPMPVARILHNIKLGPSQMTWQTVECSTALRRIEREFQMTKACCIRADVLYIEGVPAAAIVHGSRKMPMSETLYVKRGIDHMFGGTITRLSMQKYRRVVRRTG